MDKGIAKNNEVLNQGGECGTSELSRTQNEEYSALRHKRERTLERRRVLRQQKRRYKIYKRVTGDTQCQVRKCPQQGFDSNLEKTLQWRNECDTDSGESVEATYDSESEAEWINSDCDTSTSSETIESSFNIRENIENWNNDSIFDSELGGCFNLSSNQNSSKRKREFEVNSEYGKGGQKNAREKPEIKEHEDSPQSCTSQKRKRIRQMVLDQEFILQRQGHTHKINPMHLSTDVISTAAQHNALRKEALECINKAQALDKRTTSIAMDALCRRIKMLRCDGSSIPEELRWVSLPEEIKSNEET